MKKVLNLFPLQTKDSVDLEKELQEERASLLSQIEAIDKILPLRKELNSLTRADYKPSIDEEDGEREFDTGQAYTDPERATRLIIELFQLQLQREGKKRINIIPFERALVYQKDRLLASKKENEVTPESV